jgi:hypothetical protein
MPFPPMIGKKITKMLKMSEDSNMTPANKTNMLILFTDPTPFKSEIYLSIKGTIPNANNATISGTFISRVFEGGYTAIPKFIKQMNEYLADENKKAKTYYTHYAYCPGCAKKYGHNYVILFAQVQ